MRLESAKEAVAVLHPETIDRLYYATGSSGGSERVLHVHEDCESISAKTLHGCPASHPPRGQLCNSCAEYLTIDRIRGQEGAR